MTIYSLIRSVPPSILAYKYKGNKNLILLAYLSLFLIWPLILIQVMQSWNKASLKLKQGALIKIIRS